MNGIFRQEKAEEIGYFCHLKESDGLMYAATNQSRKAIAANFEQKLRFVLHQWDGSPIHFQYKPYRKSCILKRTSFYAFEP